jgi:hypothetical protein
LALRKDQDAACQSGLSGHGGKECDRREGFVERVFFAVDRLPIAACRGTEDMIGDLDMAIAKVFCGLRPIADFRRIIADGAGREKSAEFHSVLVSVRKDLVPDYRCCIMPQFT